jgi:hypothetical protein
VGCGHYTHAFTHDEMISTVMLKVFKLPQVPPTIKIPKGLRVYLKHHGPDATEKQASELAVQSHVRLTGQLPIVGKPLFTAPTGIGNVAAAIPYGEVTRVET